MYVSISCFVGRVKTIQTKETSLVNRFVRIMLNIQARKLLAISLEVFVFYLDRVRRSLLKLNISARLIPYYAQYAGKRRHF